jgi:hypothetical protein
MFKKEECSVKMSWQGGLKNSTRLHGSACPINYGQQRWSWFFLRYMYAIVVQYEIRFLIRQITMIYCMRERACMNCSRKSSRHRPKI